MYRRIIPAAALPIAVLIASAAWSQAVPPNEAAAATVRTPGTPGAAGTPGVIQSPVKNNSPVSSAPPANDGDSASSHSMLKGKKHKATAQSSAPAGDKSANSVAPP